MTSGPCAPTAAADNPYLSSVELRRFSRGRADAQTGTAVDVHPPVHVLRHDVKTIAREASVAPTATFNRACYRLNSNCPICRTNALVVRKRVVPQGSQTADFTEGKMAG